jgi:CheY-like chemotaxis protein
MSSLVLVADGDSERGKRIAAACSARGLKTSLARDGSAALQATLAEPPGVLVAHLDLPLVGGAKLAQILEANPRTRGIAVLLTGDASAADAPGGRRVSPDSDPEAVARGVEGLLQELARGRATEAPAGTGLEGQLAELPLADVLELLQASRKTGILEITPAAGGAAGVARIYLRGGELVQAVAGPAEGEKALFRLLAWERGSFAFRAQPVEIAPRLKAPTRALLREGQRQLEEWRGLAVELPSLDAHVELRGPRSSLPNVIHPLTQEVLVVLELYSRVGDVLDHCSYPDYQVLRTLQSLIERGLLAPRSGPVTAREPDAAVFSPEQAARLREWLAESRPGAEPVSEAKLLVLGADPDTTRRLCGLLARLPGMALAASPPAGPAADELAPLGRLAVDEEVGLELVHVPAAERFGPLWVLAGHGALATLVPICEPVARAAQVLRPATAALRRQPRARLLYLLLLESGERVAPEVLRENLSLLDDGPLFLLPLDHPEKAALLLRDLFGRALP